VYDARLVRFEVDEELYVRVHFADGTVYENDYFHDAVYNESAVLAESYAKGGTGYREGENTDNAMYYKNVALSESMRAREATVETESLLDEAKLHSIFTAFFVDFETGELKYVSANYDFEVNENGDLIVRSEEGTDPKSLFGRAVDDYLDKKTAELDAKIEALRKEISTI
jgi:hypothetical protein